MSTTASVDSEFNALPDTTPDLLAYIQVPEPSTAVLLMLALPLLTLRRSMPMVLLMALFASPASAASFSLVPLNEHSQSNPGVFLYDVRFQTDADEPGVIGAGLRIEYVNALDPEVDTYSVFAIAVDTANNPFQFPGWSTPNPDNPFLPLNRIDIGGGQAEGDPLPTVDASQGISLGILTLTVREPGVYALNSISHTTRAVDIDFNELNDTTPHQLAYFQVPEPSILLILLLGLLWLSLRGSTLLGILAVSLAGSSSAASFSLIPLNEQSQANPGTFVYVVRFQTEPGEPEVLAANLEIEYISALDPETSVIGRVSFVVNQENSPFQFDVFQGPPWQNPFVPQNRIHVGGAQAEGDPLPTVDASEGISLGLLTMTVVEPGTYAADPPCILYFLSNAGRGRGLLRSE